MAFIRILLLSSLVLLAGLIPVSGQAMDGTVVFRSAAELERAILNDRLWLEEADRLMNELKTIDVQLYTFLTRATAAGPRNTIIRERNNIRRLMVELVEARNAVHERLSTNLEQFQKLQLVPAAGMPAP